MTRDSRLWATALGAQALDLASTGLALSRFSGTEANPTVAAAIEAAGVPGLVGLHLVVVAAVGAVWAVHRSHIDPGTSWLHPAVLSVGGALPAAANIARMGVVA